MTARQQQCCCIPEATGFGCNTCLSNLPSSVNVAIWANFSVINAPQLINDSACASNIFEGGKCGKRKTGDLTSSISLSFSTILHRIGATDTGWTLGAGCEYRELADTTESDHPCWPDPDLNGPAPKVYGLRTKPTIGSHTEQTLVYTGSTCNGIGGSLTYRFFLAAARLTLLSDTTSGFPPGNVNQNVQCACWSLDVGIGAVAISGSQVWSCSKDDPRYDTITGTGTVFEWNDIPELVYDINAYAAAPVRFTSFTQFGTFTRDDCLGGFATAGGSAVMLRHTADPSDITNGKWNRSSVLGTYRETTGFSYCNSTIKPGISFSAIVS